MLRRYVVSQCMQLRYSLALPCSHCVGLVHDHRCLLHTGSPSFLVIDTPNTSEFCEKTHKLESRLAALDPNGSLSPSTAMPTLTPANA